MMRQPSRAAEACATLGNIDEAIRVVLRFEPLTYEADRLLSAATVLRRLSKAKLPSLCKRQHRPPAQLPRRSGGAGLVAAVHAVVT